MARRQYDDYDDDEIMDEEYDDYNDDDGGYVAPRSAPNKVGLITLFVVLGIVVVMAGFLISRFMSRNNAADSATETATIPEVQAPGEYVAATDAVSDVTLAATQGMELATVPSEVFCKITESSEAVAVKFNEGDTLSSIDVPERDGYVFSGWSYNGSVIPSSTALTPDMSLTAVWEPLAIQLTFQASPGVFADGEQQKIVEYVAGNQLQIPQQPSIENQRFVGWFYDDGNPFDLSAWLADPNKSSVSLVALYDQLDGFQLIYDSNNDDDLKAYSSYPYDTKVLINTCPFVSQDKVFFGWSTVRDGSGITYVPGDVYITPSSAGETVLYAQWTDPSSEVLTITNVEVGTHVVVVSYEGAVKSDSGTYRFYLLGEDGSELLAQEVAVSNTGTVAMTNVEPQGMSLEIRVLRGDQEVAVTEPRALW